MVTRNYHIAVGNVVIDVSGGDSFICAAVICLVITVEEAELLLGPSDWVGLMHVDNLQRPAFGICLV